MNDDLLRAMVEELEAQRSKLWGYTAGRLLHEPATNQLEAAIKSLDTTIGLLRGVDQGRAA
jgi:hypothetical protein